MGNRLDLSERVLLKRLRAGLRANEAIVVTRAPTVDRTFNSYLRMRRELDLMAASLLGTLRPE